MLLEFGTKEQRQILDKLLLDEDVDKNLEKLNQNGDLYFILPEVHQIVGFGGKGEGHKDLWPHTKQVVKQTDSDVLIKWAALFHDVGKPDSLVKHGDKVSFYNHEIKSAIIFKKFAKRTGFFSKEEKDTIIFLIENLGRVENYNENWSDSAVRRFARDMGEHIDRILMLAKADVTSSRIEVRKHVHEKVEELKRRILEIKLKDSQRPLLPKGIGSDIMRSFGLSTGEKVGQIKGKLEKLIKEQELEPYQDSIYYIEYIDDHRDQFNIETEITRLNLKK